MCLFFSLYHSLIQHSNIQILFWIFISSTILESI